MSKKRKRNSNRKRAVAKRENFIKGGSYRPKPQEDRDNKVSLLPNESSIKFSPSTPTGPSSDVVSTGPGFTTGQGFNFYEGPADGNDDPVDWDGTGKGRGGKFPPRPPRVPPPPPKGPIQGPGGPGGPGGPSGPGEGGTGPTGPAIPSDLPPNWDTMTDAQKKDWFEDQRRGRVSDTGAKARNIATGNIPEGTVPVPNFAKIGRVGTEAPTVVAPDAGQVLGYGIDQTRAEEVDTIDTSTLQQVDPAREVVTTGMGDGSKINKAAEAEAAIADEADVNLAKAANVANAPIINDVDVVIQKGAVAERVVGKLSENALAPIVENVGSSLAKITRAKKQLRNAGLEEGAIEELGNDPQALEDRLTSFTERERGVIEGLPEEALVSNQIDTLLKGVEEGEIPVWARPAVASVETMLAKRGLEASSIARDALVNTIIQSSLPIAQANAQAIQASVAQQRGIEAAESEANAQRRQQTVLSNAQNVFNLDMAQFTSDQQKAMADSKFFQTVSLTEASNEQQSAIQNAAMKAQENLADADFYQKTQIQNAQAFLQTDMANLSNQQAANVIKAQNEQQRLLSNQAAQNAARQFNATSDQQAQQFMSQIETQIKQYNAGQINLVKQYNSQQANAAEARDVQRIADVNKANSAIMNQVEQFNEQLNYNRQQWNAANEQAVINSNYDWRRKANTADTAAQNAINQQNAQNAFGLTQAAQSFLWQELRDQADYDFRWATDTANRKLQAMMSAAQAEGDAAKTWSSNFDKASNVVNRLFGSS